MISTEKPIIQMDPMAAVTDRAVSAVRPISLTMTGDAPKGGGR